MTFVLGEELTIPWASINRSRYCVAFVEGLVGTVVFLLRELVPIAQVVEQPPWEWEVTGFKPCRAIPKALEMVPVATLLGAPLTEMKS